MVIFTNPMALTSPLEELHKACKSSGSSSQDQRLDRRVIFLEVLPLVVTMVASDPLISNTSPSIHAASGSSAQIWDPTIMFTGVPLTMKKAQDHSLLIRKRRGCICIERMRSNGRVC